MVVYLFLHIELERRKAKLKPLGLRNGSKRNGNVKRKEMWPRGKHTSGKERDVWNTVYLFYSINFLSKHWYCVEKLPSKIRYTIEMLLIPGNSGTHTQCFLELVYHYYKEIEVSSFCLFMCLFLCFFIIIVCLLEWNLALRTGSILSKCKLTTLKCSFGLLTEWALKG